MKRKICIFVIMSLSLYLLTNCDYRQEKLMTVCDCEQKKGVKDFIQSSIKNANNMSDEEMEDVIYELRKTGLSIICDRQMIDGTFDGHHNMIKQHTELDSCQTLID